MKVQLVLMVALGVVIPTAMSANQHCTQNPEWQAYKVKFEKQYSSDAEESRRCMIWQQNYDEVQRHNADQSQTYKKAVNHFADQTLEERKRSRGLVLPQGLEKLSAPIGKKLVTPPASFDWRSFNAVASVKNQKSCGSCWSFSVTGVMESQYFFKTNKLVSFSQQQLIDCDTYDSGCNGGWPANTLKYVKNTGGLETLTDYPYLAKQQSKCKYNKTLALKMKVTGIYTVSDTSVLTDATIQSWIYNYGPLGVAVCASQSGFDTYSSGVYKGAEVCVDIDHAVLLVGYVNNGTSCYYILKNSWGTTWGMNGYMNIACGSNKLVQHPTVATITV